MSSERPMKGALIERLRSRSAVVCVVGMGYVGLPLAIEFARRGFRVVGKDSDEAKLRAIAAGDSGQRHILHEDYKELVSSDKLVFAGPGDAVPADAYIVCVPTPLTADRNPDLTCVREAMQWVARVAPPGCLVALESTTYPGTTREVIAPMVNGSKQRFVAYSPERQDPGNEKWKVGNTPKVVGAVDSDALDVAVALYSELLGRDNVVAVGSADAAEMVKIFENVFRLVNIALVNELKMLCRELEIDVWEVVRAAASKPFGFQSFAPGPGVAGHCIPIDPFYLTWKARQVGMPTRFIELAGEINRAMPAYVVDRVREALNERKRAVNGSTVLVLGLAYKRNVSDTRESCTYEIVDRLQGDGATVLLHDPHVPGMGEADLAGLVAAANCAVIVTDHDEYKDRRTMNLLRALPVVDTRGIMADGPEVYRG